MNWHPYDVFGFKRRAGIRKLKKEKLDEAVKDIQTGMRDMKKTGCIYPVHEITSDNISELRQNYWYLRVLDTYTCKPNSEDSEDYISAIKKAKEHGLNRSEKVYELNKVHSNDYAKTWDI